MKKLFALLLLLVPYLGQAQDCSNPISANAFQMFFNGIAGQPTDEKKLERAFEMLRQACLTSEQVKNIAVLFKSDAQRLEFGREAWRKTFDRVNFFDVYDTFTSLSNALRLYDFTRTGNISKPVVPTPVVTTPEPSLLPVEPVFAKISYPSDVNYNGRVGCIRTNLAQDKFMALAREVASNENDEMKIEILKMRGPNVCYSLEQLMKLSSLIKSEDQRINGMYEFFKQVHDQDNYAQGRAVFSSQLVKDQWMNLIGQYFNMLAPPVEAKPIIPDCTASDADLKNTIRSVNLKNFPSDKMDALKFAAKNKCYSIPQIRVLCDLFIIDNQKLDVVKIFYEKCPEKDHYNQLSDLFISYYFQQELMKFIENGGK